MWERLSLLYWQITVEFICFMVFSVLCKVCYCVQLTWDQGCCSRHSSACTLCTSPGHHCPAIQVRMPVQCIMYYMSNYYWPASLFLVWMSDPTWTDGVWTALDPLSSQMANWILFWSLSWQVQIRQCLSGKAGVLKKQEFQQILVILKHICNMHVDTPKWCCCFDFQFVHDGSNCSAFCPPLSQCGQIGAIIRLNQVSFSKFSHWLFVVLVAL